MQGIAVSKNIEKTEDDENKTKKPMKQHIQVWHFVIYVFTSIAAVVTGAMMISSMYTNHEERIKHLEEFKIDMKQDIKDIKTDQGKILILLQNKQDRK
jgi:Tfp pilus assembly protein PilN